MIKSKKTKKGSYILTQNNKKIGEVFRTGFGGNIEWTLIDIQGDIAQGHRTKKSALTEMKFKYGKKKRKKNGRKKRK